jgi:predicted methyltransferase
VPLDGAGVRGEAVRRLGEELATTDQQPIILSHFQAQLLRDARRHGRSTASTSLDLGLSVAEVRLEPERVVFPDGQWLAWAGVDEIGTNETACFVVDERGATKIQAYSEELDRFYSLMPTAGAPTVLISGIPMHRIKDVDPAADTRNKIRSIAPIVGSALDTATGLGYTAIEAARTADHVVTLELDPIVQDVARFNPWSRALFTEPKIQQLYGDSFDEVERFSPESFACVIHDPPTFALAGQLYSTTFYQRLYRVVKRGGRLFHYVGDPRSSSGKRTTQGVIRRLREAGFTRISPRPEAYGVVAFK